MNLGVFSPLQFSILSSQPKAVINVCTRLPIHVPILSYRAPVCGWPAVTQSPGHGGGGWGGVMMMLLMVMMMVMIMDLIAQLTKRSLTMSGKRGKQRRITIPIYRGKTETLRG